VGHETRILMSDRYQYYTISVQLNFLIFNLKVEEAYLYLSTATHKDENEQLLILIYIANDRLFVGNS
jgi:hypothetical protein